MIEPYHVLMHVFSSLVIRPSPSESLPILTRSVVPRLSEKSFATFKTPLRGLKPRSSLRSLSGSTLKLIPFWVIVTLSVSSVVKKKTCYIFYSVLLRFDSNFLINTELPFASLPKPWSLCARPFI